MATKRASERDAERSRSAILDAAERLFADQGFATTTLAQVGQQAGVSRGTPGYFFGTKGELYHAVLERCLEQVRGAVRKGRERTRSGEHTTEQILEGAVSDYFDFLASHPQFVRLIEREALSTTPSGADGPPRLTAGEEALAAIAAELDLDSSPSGDAAQLLLSIISLCWFPVIHARTVAQAVGVDVSSPEALARRKQHVTALVTHGLRGLYAEQR